MSTPADWNELSGYCLSVSSSALESTRFQTWDKRLRCLFNSKAMLAASTPQSLPLTGPSCLAYPILYPQLLQPRTGLPYPQLLLTAAPGLPFSSCPSLLCLLSVLRGDQGHVQTSLPLAMLSHISTTNLLLHHT